MRLEAGGDSILYTADTSFKEEFISFSHKVNVLLCECNFYGNKDGSKAGHMTSIDGGNLAQAAQAEKLVLTHLPHYGDLEQLKEEAATRFKGPIVLAHNGLNLRL